MKTIRKALAVFLAVLMLSGLAVLFSSCSNVSEENPGAIIEIYMPYTVSLDPAVAYADADSAKLLPLLYQGLTTIDKNGRLKGALADEWEEYTNRDGEHVLEIKLKTTHWSDGTLVTADDFINSWERILDPAFNCEAAALLFPIKNAAAVKSGGNDEDVRSISDLGIDSTREDTLTITLEDWASGEQFLRNCASVALYPIRSDVIKKIYNKEEDKENDWSTLVAIMQSNGPFYLKRVSFGTTQGEDADVASRPSMIFERNLQFYRDQEKENVALDKYVTPYRIMVNMTYGHDDTAAFLDARYARKIAQNPNLLENTIKTIRDAMTEEEKESYGSALEDTLKAMAESKIREDVRVESSADYLALVMEDLENNKSYFVNQYTEGKILANGALPAGSELEANHYSAMSTGSLLFNEANPLFADARVRRALSLALDREAIAAAIGCGSAASTLITDGVFETERKTSFRANASSYALSTGADIDAAKALLREAGVSGGSFSIAVRATEYDIIIAQMAADAWKSLGFDVSVRIYGYNIVTYNETTHKKDENGNMVVGTEVVYDGLLHDDYLDAYNNADFDVILADINMLTTDAFVPLAAFAGVYCGRAYSFDTQEDFDILQHHVTGYYNKDYDDLMMNAIKEQDAAKRAALLHQAEALLLNDMPIAPVIFWDTTIAFSGELDDVILTYFGGLDFTEAEYKNYVPVVEEETTEGNTDENPEENTEENAE